MPLELEIGLLCQEFNTTPGTWGFDNHNPKFIRQVRMCMAIHKALQSQRQAKDKIAWKNDNPEAVHFLRWARGGESQNADPSEVQITLPERPAKRRR